MSDFTFTAANECEVCGKPLSPDESCDHDGFPVKTHVFRRMFEGRDSLVGVKTIKPQKWEMLRDEIGDDWIAYQYLGTRDDVNKYLSSGWDSVEDIPMKEMSTDAKKDLSE